MCVCAFVCVHLGVYACVYMCLCVYIYVCVYMCVYVPVCVMRPRMLSMSNLTSC